MGEIGIPRLEYLYDLEYWEIMLIVRGYIRRSRDLWSATRWQTYNLMCVSMANIKKAGIHSPTDLLRFPWEDGRAGSVSPDDIPDKDEVERMRRQMMEENERRKAQQEDDQSSS